MSKFFLTMKFPFVFKVTPTFMGETSNNFDCHLCSFDMCNEPVVFAFRKERLL